MKLHICLKTAAALMAFLPIALGTAAQQNTALCSENPRLVLFIIVDNLNNEQLEIIRPKCGRDGINRLLNHGTQLNNAYYDAGTYYTGSNLSTLFSGATPATHGITGRQWIDRLSNKTVYAAYGNTSPTDSAATPTGEQMLCTTISNEIRKIYGGKAKIMSIGFDHESLVWNAGAGRQETMAWLDTKTGHMNLLHAQADTTAKWTEAFNSKDIADLYTQKTWSPRNDINEYHEWKYFSPTNKPQRTFYYSLAVDPLSGKDKYGLVAGSPYGNSLVRDYAVAAILNEDIGKDDVPDLLTVHFTATPSCASKRQPLDAETEDLLLGLDDNIASLLLVIDKYVGMDNTLVVFTSANGQRDVANTDSEHWQTRGAVSLRRTAALLNLYLMALHGQEQWVQNHIGCQLMLDRRKAEETKVDWNTLLNETADFLLQVKGIGNAIIAKNLQSTYSDSPAIAAWRNTYNPSRTGDILITLDPGWTLEQDNGEQLSQLWGYEYVPLVFYGWKIPRTTIYERHNITDVAPTVCSLIRVAQPNGSSGTPLPLIDTKTPKNQ